MNTLQDSVALPSLAAWETPPCPFRIEFAPVVLEEIGLWAVDALYSVPRGGLEVGGVLFGSVANDSLRISSWRKISCEYAFGPSFKLSTADEQGMERLIADSGLEPVGWFQSHTRAGISLTPGALEFFERFFPGKRQVALVLQPGHADGARAGFFFRDQNGRIETAASYREFSFNAESFARMGIRGGGPALVERPALVNKPAENRKVETNVVEAKFGKEISSSGIPVRSWFLAVLSIALAVSFAAGYWVATTYR